MLSARGHVLWKNWIHVGHWEDAVVATLWNQLLYFSLPALASAGHMLVTLMAWVLVLCPIELHLIMSIDVGWPTQAISSTASGLWSSVIKAESFVWFLLATWGSLPLLELVAQRMPLRVCYGCTSHVWTVVRLHHVLYLFWLSSLGLGLALILQGHRLGLSFF